MEAQVEGGRSVSWAAILLPLLAVAGAVGCFAAGLQANSTANEPLVGYMLPLVVSPVIAAVVAILASVLRRGTLYILGAGYVVVAVSLILGLVTASSSGS
jgi:asparagine N-glycosylation enzyme membrane subunit Stt3